MTPESVSAGSSFLAAWRCERGCKECGGPHEWHAAVSSRCLDGTGCPFCSGIRVCPCHSLAAKHKALMDDWDYEANTGLDPESVCCQSCRKAAWRCQQCGHRWAARINSRVRQGCGCPSCARANRVQSKPRLLKDEHPDIFAEIHPTKNAGVDVSSFKRGSGQELWWLCNNTDGRPDGCQCEHAWKARIQDRCRQNYPTGCPYHSGRAVCACKSIARLYPHLMNYWCSPLNLGLKAEAIGAASHQEVWWEHLCVDGQMHRQQLRVNDIVRHYKRTGRISCRTCANKEISGHHAKHRGHAIDRD